MWESRLTSAAAVGSEGDEELGDGELEGDAMEDDDDKLVELEELLSQPELNPVSSDSRRYTRELRILFIGIYLPLTTLWLFDGFTFIYLRQEERHAEG